MRASERASVDELEKTYAELDKIFQDELNQIEEMLNKFDECRTAVQSSQNITSQNSASTKTSQKVFSKNKQVVTSTNNEEGFCLFFFKNKTMLKFIHDMKSLDKTRHLKHNLNKIKAMKASV